jgi:hypothetical protein
MSPIRAENRKRYPKDWRVMSDYIRFIRADGRCECAGECGLHQRRRCREVHGHSAKWANGKVILTVAHLNHQPEDCAPDNLKAMCQRCHNRYDTVERRAGIRQRKDALSGQQLLFQDHR